MNDVKRLLTFEMDLPGGKSRLREMILYVSSKCETAKRFGKIKLNKILWRADFSAFEARMVPVTGRSYQKLTAGPAPIEMPLILEEMQAAKLIAIERVDLGNDYIDDRVKALASPSLVFFSPDDIRYVDEAISFYWSKTASRASDLSHGIAWKSRKFLDPIPYEATFLSNDKLPNTTLEKLGAIAKQKKWSSL